MANLVYNAFKTKLLNLTDSIDFASDTIKVMLVTSSYTPADAHDFINDVSSNEVSGAGYTSGGATLSGLAVTQDDTDDEGVFDANDVSWTTATITARGAVIYKDSGSAATSPIVGYIDFTTDRTSTAGTFTITWNAEGILNIG